MRFRTLAGHYPGRGGLMMLFEFQLHDIPAQAAILYDQGVYIGKRKEGCTTILLYQLDSFYVEVFYTKYRHYIARIRCSGSTSLLDPYLEQIDVERYVSS